MASFIISAIYPNNKVTKLKYDNQTSELTWLDTGESVLPPPKVETKWGTATVVSREAPGTKHHIKVLKISLGLSCNYACTYCSQRFVPHAANAGLDDVPKFVANLPSWFDVEGNDGKGGGLKIEFWGGEPLVYIKTLRPLAEALRDMMPNARFSLITNGSLLNPEINEWLDRLDFGIAISHDGPGQHVRGPDPLDDPHSRAGIMDLYERLHAKGRISLNSMIHRDNTSRAAIQTWFRERFGEDVTIGEGTFVDPYDAGGLASMLQDGEHHSYRLRAFREIREGMTASFDVVRKKLSGFVDGLQNRRPADSLGQKCSMDRHDNIAVTLKGDVMTCQNVSPIAKAPNGESHRLGTVDKLSEVKLRTATHWSKRPECADCPVLQLCGGACMFLQGEHWEAACDTAFSDNIPFFAAAIEYLTGAIPFKIEGPQRADRQMIWK